MTKLYKITSDDLTLAFISQLSAEFIEYEMGLHAVFHKYSWHFKGSLHNEHLKMAHQYGVKILNNLSDVFADVW